jgi:hypothetical protein
MKLPDDEIEIFYNKLAETDMLVKYFNDGFDFGVDAYDPIIDDLYEIMENFTLVQNNFYLDSI